MLVTYQFDQTGEEIRADFTNQTAEWVVEEADGTRISKYTFEEILEDLQGMVWRPHPVPIVIADLAAALFRREEIRDGYASIATHIIQEAIVDAAKPYAVLEQYGTLENHEIDIVIDLIHNATIKVGALDV